MNNQDDLARGKGNNPFGNYRDASPVQTKSPNGPFPGDESIFSFNLYRDAGLQNRVGVAVFTCEYDFGKNAFCDVAFELTNGGTMLAEGFFNFEATAFTLAVTGGYGGLEGEKGTVEEIRARSTQRGSGSSSKPARTATRRRVGSPLVPGPSTCSSIPCSRRRRS